MLSGDDVSASSLRAPFPWYGGKSNAAPLIWRAFGNVPNYVEPFAGSMAVLLSRPSTPKVETVNDKDGLIANFWRAVQHAPDEVARWADWPVNEADLHARHRWLIDQALPLTEKLIGDVEYYDAKVAGWWVWGICTWIGGGWCAARSRPFRQRPHLTNTGGRGVHALRRQIPKLSKAGEGIHSPTNKRSARDSAGIVESFVRLAERLRDVRVCCGDWTRVLGRSTLGIAEERAMTPCGILLDPPYSDELRDERVYREDEANVSADARVWAIEHGDDPRLRIALCGYDGEHEMPGDWSCVEWRSTGSGQNRTKERIWFSPHCAPALAQADLFGASA